MYCTFRYNAEDNVVELLGRMEGTPRASDEGMLGDARWVVSPGEDFFGLPFDELVRARAGSVEVVNGIHR